MGTNLRSRTGPSPTSGRKLAARASASAIALVVMTATAGCILWEQKIASTVEVEAGKTAQVSTPDGKVNVTVPGESIRGSGTLSVAKAAGEKGEGESAGESGWNIDMDGAQLTGPATIRFKLPAREQGEPAPVAVSAPAVGEPITATPGAKVSDGFLVVSTDHFSWWDVVDWSDLRDAFSDGLDKIISGTGDGAAATPQCPDEAAAERDGFSAESDSGSRVKWCLGKEKNGRVVLKVVNARSYGVSAESTPQLDVVNSDRNDVATTVASWVKPPPSRRGNTVTLLPSGNELTYSISGTRSAVRVIPDAGAYLVEALLYGIDTLFMTLKKVDTAADPDRFLEALETSACIPKLLDMAATKLDSVGAVRDFFADALDLSLSCVGDVAGEVVGGINKWLVEPILWLLDGVRLVTAAAAAAIDGGLDLNGYRITVSGPAVLSRAAQLSNAPIPASCEHRAARLRDFRYEAPSGFGGAQLEKDMAVFGDVTGDGRNDAVVPMTCSIGGVAWPQLLLVYTVDQEGRVVLAGWTNFIDLGRTVLQEHVDARELKYVPGKNGDPGSVSVEFNSYEGASGAVTTYTGQLRAANGKVTFSYDGPWTIDYTGGGGTDAGHPIDSPDDFDVWMTTAPKDFTDFLADLLPAIAADVQACGLEGGVTVTKYSHLGFAQGTVGTCGSYAVYWAKSESGWEEILGFQEDPACANVEADQGLKRAMRALGGSCLTSQGAVRTLGDWPGSGR